MLLLLAGGQVSRTTAADQPAPWDDHVEYKLSLTPPAGVADVFTAAIAAAWTETTGKPLALKLERCRTIRFYDTKSRAFRERGIALRLRVRGPKKDRCLAGDQPLSTDDGWDASVKWTSEHADERPSGEGIGWETDWLAAGDPGPARIRFAAAAEHKQTAGAPPSNAAGVFAAFAAPVRKLLGEPPGVESVCAAPVEDLRWQDEQTAGEPTVTLWRQGGTLIAAELSFDGASKDEALADALRATLREKSLLAPKAVGKIQAVYAHCPP
jgi:hypothetical protein